MQLIMGPDAYYLGPMMINYNVLTTDHVGKTVFVNLLQSFTVTNGP